MPFPPLSESKVNLLKVVPPVIVLLPLPNLTVLVLAVKVPLLVQLPEEIVRVRLPLSSVSVPPLLIVTEVTVGLVSSVTVWVLRMVTVSAACGVVPPQVCQVPATDQLPVALDWQAAAKTCWASVRQAKIMSILRKFFS